MGKTRLPPTLPVSEVMETAQSAGGTDQDRLGNSALAAQVNGAQTDRTDITKLTPEYVTAHRDELGIPKDAPVEDFFYEFIAKTLATHDASALDPSNPDLNDADRARAAAQAQLLNSWGYQASAGAEVKDPDTGLYAVRYDPLQGAAGEGKDSVVAFRGTDVYEPGNFKWSAPIDVFGDVSADIGPSVGSSQFDANKEELEALLHGGTDKAVVTGHSLGGYLAQRLAAEDPDAVDSVVTYQAGGIDEDSADAFNEANKDGHIDVRHHQTNWDVVHRAGEERLDGSFYEHRPNDPTLSGHGATLMYDDNDTTSISELGHGKTMESYDHDPVSPMERHLWEAGRSGIGGLVHTLGAPLGAAWTVGSELTETFARGGSPMETISGIGTALGDGAMSLGHGLATGVGELASSGENLLEAGWEGAKSLGSSVADGAKSLGSSVVEGAGSLFDKVTSW